MFFDLAFAESFLLFAAIDTRRRYNVEEEKQSGLGFLLLF